MKLVDSLEKEDSKNNLLSRWKDREDNKKTSFTIPKAPEGTIMPLSNGQRRLWFLQDINPDNSFYNFGESFRLKGKYSIPKLKKSIAEVYQANTILRSYCFRSEEGIELKTSEDKPLEIDEVDFSHLSEVKALNAAKIVVHKNFTTTFDLTQGPLIRVTLIKLATDHYIFCIAMHHIITDEWSMEIFLEQLSNFYTQLGKEIDISSNRRGIQYADYSYWDVTRTIPKSEIDFWKENLSGDIPKLQLETDYNRPKQPSYRGKHRSIKFSRGLSQRLLQMAKESQVTPFVLLLSVFYTFLYRHTGQKEILVGSPIANRNHKELEGLMGFFVDTLILRNEISAKTTFAALLSNVKKNTLEAFLHKDVPFDVLVKELNPERSSGINPFFQVMFVYNAASQVPNFGEDLIFEKVDLVDIGSSKFDLTLFVIENDGILSASFEYATDLFKASTVERYLQHLVKISEEVTSNKNWNIGAIPILTDTEKIIFQKNLKNEVTDEIEENFIGIYDLVAKYAIDTPEANSITFGDNSLTYRELIQRSNHVATEILKITEGNKQIVGLCIDRSLEMIIGLLGILRSGCAYLPLDPEYPQERTKYIVQDSGVGLVLIQPEFHPIFENIGIKSLVIPTEQLQRSIDTLTFPKVSPNDLAYVIYTSGSTGKPKGVPITHKNLISSTTARFTFYDNNPKAFLLLSSISFDSSKAGIFWTLCTGGNLIISEKRMEQDMALIGRSIVKNKVSHMLTLPTLYRLMLENIDAKKLKTLTTVIVAGEACHTHIPKSHFKALPEVDLYNEYGPTESTVWCMAYKMSIEDEYDSIPIGKAIEGVNIYLLDESLNQVPLGAIGEIYISGKGLSNGYLNNPELTANKFVNKLFSSKEKPTRMYRSGDLGRYLDDGSIVFVGRVDTQVKLRGFRIELDEIERAILQYPNIIETAVLIRSTPEMASDSSGFLVAYVTAKNPFESQRLTAYLKQQLPKHMLPVRIIQLENFIKLPNGKIDKKHLQNLPLENLNNFKGINEATTGTEKKLKEIWEGILGFDGLTVNDNFFEIGGDSIMTIQVISKARKMGMAISPNQIFEYQTIKELALFVDQNQQKADAWDYIVPLRKGGSKKPLFCIHAGGGHVFFYNKLTDHLATEIPVYALQPSGVYGDKSMHKTVREMTQAYLDSIFKIQPHGPYNILVYCFSVAVGIEMALILKDMNEEINLIVMDTMTAPAVLNTPRRLKIRILTFLIRFFRSPFRSIKTMLISKYALIRLKWRSSFEMDKEARELEKLRANLMQLSRSYEWKPFNGKTSLILTQKDHEALNKETIRSWKEIAEDELQILRTQGSHQALFEEPYVKHTAEAIEKCLL